MDVAGGEQHKSPPSDYAEDDDEDSLDDEKIFYVEQKVQDMFGRDTYLERCKQLKISPAAQCLKYFEMEDMYIANYGLGVNGVDALCAGLKVNSTITSLNLDGNNIRDEGMEKVAEVALAKRNITMISLANCGIGPESAKHIQSLLQFKASDVTNLNLQRNKLGDKGMCAIAEELTNNTCLETLDISQCYLGERAAFGIGAMLSSNSYLTTAIMAWNNFLPKGFIAVCEGLRSNVALRTIDLSSTGMQDAGAAALFEVLSVTATLRNLYIRCNSITAVGAQVIAQGVEENTTLALIDMQGNDLREEGGQAMKKAFEQNTGLAVVNVENCNIPPNLMIDIMDINQ